ncbi:MAG TPA: hypothetical protein VGD08_03495 [Stellaceae bacterium]
MSRSRLLRPALLALSVISALSGCAEYGPNEFGGGLLGAGGGALLGSQFGRGSGRLAATAGGALLGAWAGSGAGRSLDRANYGYGYAYAAPPPAPGYYVPAPGYYYAPAPAYYYGY